MWREHIAGGGVRVFDQDGAVVGLLGRPGRRAHGLYVDPAAQGAGVGSRLLADAQERIRAAGHARAWLYVYAENAPRVRLLRAPRLGGRSAGCWGRATGAPPAGATSGTL